jgi:hypothetical protein
MIVTDTDLDQLQLSNYFSSDAVKLPGQERSRLIRIIWLTPWDNATYNLQLSIQLDHRRYHKEWHMQ